MASAYDVSAVRGRGGSTVEELAAAQKVVAAVARSEHGAPFAEAVTPEDAPDYGDYILHPMDLGTITDRLKQGHYDSCGMILLPNPHSGAWNRSATHQTKTLKDTLQVCLSRVLVIPLKACNTVCAF